MTRHAVCLDPDCFTAHPQGHSHHLNAIKDRAKQASEEIHALEIEKAALEHDYRHLQARITDEMSKVNTKTKQPKEKKSLSLHQVADIVGTKYHHAWELVNRSEIPSFKVGGKIRVLESDLDIFIANGGSVVGAPTPSIKTKGR